MLRGKLQAFLQLLNGNRDVILGFINGGPETACFFFPAAQCDGLFEDFGRLGVCLLPEKDQADVTIDFGLLRVKL